MTVLKREMKRSLNNAKMTLNVKNSGAGVEWIICALLIINIVIWKNYYYIQIQNN